ncbi:hypothetical protein [Actinomadura chibensis]|uniref:Lipoprotein n=1 Tax=Actinomadura chibensis TaxID=392828 RepID=A0A5D0NZB7_9ACTN|nr:hypothetical protein [Actinomadura chibensis]TYB49508.1 hypothetical protein FXF69_10645 [Actinomadura chibensis]
MLHHLRAGVPAALVLALAFTAGCGPAGESDGAKKEAATAKASASPSASPSPSATDNGIANLKPAQIFARARAATASARYVRLRGQVEDGEKYKIDFRFAGKAKATGSLQQGSERAGLTVIGKVVYLSGNDGFWRSVGGKGAAQLFSGKYVKTKTDDADFRELAAFANKTALLNEAVKSGRGWRKEGAGKVGEVPTVVLTDSAGDKIQIATQGPPYVLLMEGGREDRLEYVEYGQPVTVQAPPAGSVIDPALLN